MMMLLDRCRKDVECPPSYSHIRSGRALFIAEEGGIAHILPYIYVRVLCYATLRSG